MAKRCDKCKKETDLEKHHILPKSTFGENNEIGYLLSQLPHRVPQKIREKEP